MKLVTSILTFCFVVLYSFGFSQNKKLELFDSLKTYHYKALFIDKEGDTLSNEKIIFQPTGTVWEAQKTQTLVKEFYFTSDTVFSKFKDPRLKKNQTSKYGKATESRTGAIETDSLLWIHPFRSNQYVYTEVAPFPRVKTNKLKIGNEWSGGITFILSGWGNFKGRVSSNYQVTGNIKKEFFHQELIDCWVIDAIGVHNKLGKSTLTFLYHKDYGFIEMNYVFYDGTKIQFVLDEVTIKK